jgi:protein XRP2
MLSCLLRDAFVLKDLKDCTVFLLDYTSEVEVSNCENCQIFIGPVDGPALFQGCRNCHVTSASQQFQAKECTRCDFGLYCATGPTLNLCQEITIGCWSGAYAGCSSHFHKANLDPIKNDFGKVYDASQVEGQEMNYRLIMEPQPAWVVEVEGLSGEFAENPVPGPDGSPQVPVPGNLENDVKNVEKHVDNDLKSKGSLPNGVPSATGASFGSLPDRLAQQVAFEAEEKSKTRESAANYLKEFYSRRNASKDERIKLGREASLERQASVTSGPEGDGKWQRTVSMIDFTLGRPSGTDLSRFKSILMGCMENK